MALDPTSTQRLLRQYQKPRGREPNVVVLHGTAGNDTSPYGTFAKGASCSHFWIAYDGRREQYLDTSWPSAADRDGAARSISIETSSPPSGAGVWTPEQVASIVDLLRWIRTQHPGIPLRIVGSSDASEAGIGWHRVGIDGNFPALPSLLAGRGQRGGGQLWSSARGKVCPGNDRIAQVPAILAALTTTTPAPTPVPDVQEDDVLIIRRARDGAAFLVIGGIGSRIVTGSDLAALGHADVKTANVSDLQYAEFAARYLKGA